MIKKHEHHAQQTNFWSGIAMGAIFGASSLYLFGTKNGRKFVRQMLEAVENIEDMGDEVLEEVQEYFSEERKPESVSNVESIIEKIQSAIPEKEQIKKYFFKDGKVLK